MSEFCSHFNFTFWLVLPKLKYQGSAWVCEKVTVRGVVVVDTGTYPCQLPPTLMNFNIFYAFLCSTSLWLLFRFWLCCCLMVGDGWNWWMRRSVHGMRCRQRRQQYLCLYNSVENNQICFSVHIFYSFIINGRGSEFSFKHLFLLLFFFIS